ncbi:MAG: hypothetical protein QM778_23760 [Myxococcales bacterium]
MFTQVQARVLAVVGLALWLLAGGSEVWEVLAVQAPDSPFHLGLLAGPVAQLRAHSFGLGAVCIGMACCWNLFGPACGWLWASVFLAGAALETTALLWAAGHGMLAVQVFDPRADARLVLYVRAAGHTLSWLAGLALWVRALRSWRSA